MAVGDIITAARYNNLQSRVATIMGTGSGDEGYGQSLNSSQVAAAEKVTATHDIFLIIKGGATKKNISKIRNLRFRLHFLVAKKRFPSLIFQFFLFYPSYLP